VFLYGGWKTLKDSGETNEGPSVSFFLVPELLSSELQEIPTKSLPLNRNYMYQPHRNDLHSHIHAVP
jgi:hypothetical protein